MRSARGMVLITLAVGIVVLAVFAGASGGGTSSSASAATNDAYRGKTIGYVQAGPIPTFAVVGKGIKKWALAHGMKYEQVVTPAVDPGQQVQGVQTLLSKNVDAIATMPLVTETLQPLINQSQGTTKFGEILSYGQSNLAIGLNQDFATAARKVMKNVADELKRQGRKCTVAIMRVLPSIKSTTVIANGFEAGAKANHCTILDQKVDAANNTASQTNIAGGWKTRFGSRLGAALVINGNQSAVLAGMLGGGFKPLIVDTGSEDNTLKLMKQGKIFADLAFPGANYSQAIAYALAQAVIGKSVPKVVYGEVPILTKKNVGRYITNSQQLAAPVIEPKFTKRGGKWYYVPRFFKRG